MSQERSERQAALSEFPVPIDDGAAAHLVGTRISSVRLPSTTGQEVDLAEFAGEAAVLYVFPSMGPDEHDPPGWRQIPGAYGCTEQTCSIRDAHDELEALGYRVAGVSAQTAAEQREPAERLHLPFPLLADSERQLEALLRLPTFTVAGRTYYKRLTLIVHRLRVVKVFYPVFPPGENGQEVLGWLQEKQGSAPSAPRQAPVELSDGGTHAAGTT